MMSSRIAEIVRRREALVAHAALQRGQIAAVASGLRPSFWLANLPLRVYGLLKSQPLWASLALGVLAVYGPRGVARLGYRGVTLFATVVPLAKVLVDLLRRLRGPA